MNKLYDTSDKTEFGQMMGCEFYWIYRLAPSYLEWLIRETEICFTNLKQFYTYGKSIELSMKAISINESKKIMHVFERLGKNNFKGNSKGYTITINILNELCKTDLISFKNFKQIDYKFSDELSMINSKKHIDCEIVSNHNDYYDSFDEIKKLYFSIQ